MTNILLLLAIIILVIFLALIIRIFGLFSKLNGSFYKLGFAIREDMKKLWETTEEKNLIIQKNYALQNQEVIKKAIEEVLEDQRQIAEKIYFEAQTKAQTIISEAKKQLEGIRAQSAKDYEYMLINMQEKSTYLIGEVLREYIGENFQISDHENIIKKLMVNLIDESRKK